MPQANIQTGARTPTTPVNAGAQNVVTTQPASRVLSKNALAKALETFQSQGASEEGSGGQRVLHAAEEVDGVLATDETQTEQGSEGAGEGTGTEAGTAEGTETAEGVAQEQTETTEGEGAEGAETTEGAEGTETAETAEGTETETNEGNEAEEAEFAKLPMGVQKRIGKLLAKQRELEAQVAAKDQEVQTLKQVGTDGARGAARPTGLDAVTNLNELAGIHEQTESALDELGSLQKRLTFAPGKVEAFLRSQKVELKDDEGNDDYSPERMADVLETFEKRLRTTLREVPRRAQYLQQHAKARETIVKQFPWMGKQGDPRAALLSTMTNANPAVKNDPSFEYWLGCAVEKHFELEQGKAVAQKGTKETKVGGQKKLTVVTTTAAGGARGATRPTGAPNTGTVGSAAPKVTDQSKLNAAKAKVMQGGGRQALAEYMGQAGRF